MNPVPAEAGPASAAARAASPATDLAWKGRPLPPGAVAGAFLLGSLAVVVLGVALNYALTGGRWHTPRDAVASAFGNGPTYLTSSPYDVVSLGILLVALLALGVGFLAPYQLTLRHRGFQALVLLAAAALAYVALIEAGLVDSRDPLFYATLAAVFGMGALAWFLARFVGAGDRMHLVRAGGFVLFGLYWATQAMRLYTVEEGDFVNAAFAALAVFFFNYFAYHELLSIRRNEDPRALHWLSGAAFLTTGLYVATHKLQVVSEWLILRVAEQTTWLLQFFDQGVERGGGDPEGSLIMYPVADPFPIQIILACTAIQSIMIFVGGIAALRPPRRGDGVSGRAQHFETLRPTYQTRRFFALLLTVPLIYSLNLLRNVVIIMLSASGNPPYFTSHAGATDFICRFSIQPNCGAADAAFWFSHNIIGKGGSLVALIIIAFMVFQILPELYDSVVGLLDLKQRRGPLERWFAERYGRRGNGGVRAPEAAPAAGAAAPQAASEP